MEGYWRRDVGLLAFRYSQGTTRKLLQEALIPLPKTDRYYYDLVLVSPGAKSGAVGVDDKEKLAADTFSLVFLWASDMSRTLIRKTSAIINSLA